MSPVLLALLILSVPVFAAEPAFRVVDRKTALRSRFIDEASGLAVSPADGRFLWLVNDSGAGPVLHLAGTDGSDRGQVSLRGVRNRDWEDLASFMLDGRPHLLVADVGDNQAGRKSCQLHLVREPRLPREGRKLDMAVKPVWSLDFRYEDGPRDCESVAVDVGRRKILLVSKRDATPFVYELPLAPAKGTATARKIGRLSVGQPRRSIPIPYGSQPTGMDISADGSLAAVVTYYGVFLFPRGREESWATAFSRKAVVLPPHLLRQAESVAFSTDGASIFVVSEGARSSIVRYARR